MLMLAVIRVMSMALSRSIQRQVTGRFIKSRKWTKPFFFTPRSSTLSTAFLHAVFRNHLEVALMLHQQTRAPP